MIKTSLQSLDINPIENVLHQLKVNIRQDQITNTLKSTTNNELKLMFSS